MIKTKTVKTLISAVALTAGISAVAQAADTVVRHLHLNNDPRIPAMWEEFAKEFEAKNPGVDIQIEFLENEAFKAKLPTMLQSKSKPDVFYSWGGLNFADRAEAGLLEDITKMSEGMKKNLSAGGMSAFTVDGKVYGAPYMLSQVGFWYNKKLFAQAGVDAGSLKTWDDFLGAVKKLKAAGITPIAVGGADKWPVHFFTTYLAMRTGGQETFNAAMADDASWDNKDYVQAFKLFTDLVALEPFQSGFMAAGYGDASGTFGDHKAAMHLMGDWDVGVQRDQSASKEGVKDADLGFFGFPAVPGGKGSGSDTLGAVNGWAFAKGASPTAVKWIEFFLGKDQQSREAAAGFIIPVAKGADKAVTDPFKAIIAKNLAKADWHQVFWDQALGADVGGVINDVSAELATGDVSPEDAAARIQEAWELK